MKLTQEIEATLIHGTTGQEISEDTLDAGTEIKNVESEEMQFSTKWTFLAPSESGQWFKYESYTEPRYEA